MLENGCGFSSNAYKRLLIKNKNCKDLRELLDRALMRSDLGCEVGSFSYIQDSPFKFMRSKALQEHSLLPQITSESTLSIMPQNFINMDLKKGDVIISKDSNIGEVAILEKDYPNTMLSSAMYKLPLSKNKFYILSFMKHRLFKEQLDFIVPKGATIRHAKQLFLNCKIPFPNHNKEKTIFFIESLTKSIIKKEALIKQRHNEILTLIETELKNNQKDKKFIYNYPTFKELQEKNRLDAGLYSKEFKEWNFIVKNYKYGSKNLIDRGFTYARGTSLEKNFIGNRLDSDIFKKGYYELLIPTNITQFGTISKTTFIGTKAQLKTIKKGDIIFGSEATFVSCVIIDDSHNIATNYHGVRLINTNNDFIESIFIRCFLEFWRVKRIFNFISVGGQGGHCAPSYFRLIETPLFPLNLQEKI
ncbi:MAG: restriction endonuclease subunit S, partial [Helicobacter sp.]|nr:restriction endonuclease subunit S [Helicobacter sp.]